VLGFVVEGAGELVDKGLGSCVGGEERRRVVPGARRDIDNGARTTVNVCGEKRRKNEYMMKTKRGSERHRGEKRRLAAALA